MNFLFLLCPILPLLVLLCDTEHVFLARDVSLVFLPAKRFWVDSILALHTVPGWNPFSYGGIPYRADPNLSPLHPLNFLFLIFPDAVEKGYLLFVGAHYLLLALGSYFLFRARKLGRDGAVLATLAWTLSGIAYSTLNIMNVAASLAALPFFLLFFLRLRRQVSWGALVGAAVAAAWPVYSGDPEVSYWMILLAACLLLRQTWRERSLRPVLRVLALAPLTCGLAAAQLLPAFALASASERGLGAFRLDLVERFSLHPLRVLEFFLPMPFGNPALAAGHWLNRFTDALFNMPFLLSLYLGILVGPLLLWAAYRQVNKHRWRRPPAWLLGLVLLAAFGRYFFVNVYGLFYYVFPGWSLFRYPERLLLLFALGAFLWLAPYFRWCAWRVRRPERFLRPRLILTVLAVAAAVALAFLSASTSSLEVHTLAKSLAHVAVALAAALLFLNVRERLPVSLRLPLLCAIVALDLLPFAFALAWKTPVPEVQFRQNTFAGKIQRNLAERGAEIKKGGAIRYFHGTYAGPFPTASTNPLTIGQAWDWGVMYPNIPMYFGIAGAAGYGSFDPKDFMALWAKFGRSDPQRLLDVFSIAYYPLRDGDHPALQLNTRALPQAWLPGGVVGTNGAAEQEALLFQKDFPYRDRAVVGGASLAWRQSRAWEIESYERTPDHAVVQLRANSPEAYFVWNERWNGNWTAVSEHLPLEVLHANAWAMAVHLKTRNVGQLVKLEFRYRDYAADLGNYLTLFTIAVILLGSFGTLLPLYRRKSAPSRR